VSRTGGFIEEGAGACVGVALRVGSFVVEALVGGGLEDADAAA